MNSDAITAAVRKALAASTAQQRIIAEMAGVTEPTLWRIAKGERGTTLDTALAIRDALDEYAANAQAVADALRDDIRAVLD